MFYYKGWTKAEYEEAYKNRKAYRVSHDFMLVPEIILTPDIILYYSEEKGVAWVEGNSVWGEDNNLSFEDHIVPLTKKQMDQMYEEGVFIRDEGED